ncbi:MAG TPA: hypothetical protein VFE42_35220 [Chloroflexota bacterium]|nr:hypothetical protein [Chloroflexota bacterium]
MSRNSLPFTTVVSEGGLLPPDLLARVAAADPRLPCMSAADYGLGRNERLNEAISRAWARVRGYWLAFSNTPPSETGVVETRHEWLLPLFRALDYGELAFQRSALMVGNEAFTISHLAGDAPDAPPVHTVSVKQDLDRPPGPGEVGGARRLSPHGLLQGYLNATKPRWGLVSNGHILRLLRDNPRLSQPAYVEFDIKAMLEGGVYADFVLLYLLLHRSRLPRGSADLAACPLERWRQEAIQEGARAKEQLRAGVETAIKCLGRGLLAHPANSALRQALADGTLPVTGAGKDAGGPREDAGPAGMPAVPGWGCTAAGATEAGKDAGGPGNGASPHRNASETTGREVAGFYPQVLRLVYRLLFMLVAEERDLIFEEGVDRRLRQIYAEHYSIARLRELADRPRARDDTHDDLWRGLQVSVGLLRDGCDALGLKPLHGGIFAPDSCPDLDGALIYNSDLLDALHGLSRVRAGKLLQRVNYRDINVEELGSVYEALLDYHPAVRVNGRYVTFELGAGSERKTTGSYYTPPELVAELIKSALEPVIEERLKGLRSNEEKADALLTITVCDPASGSGHFVLAAARRLARERATLLAGGGEPSLRDYRQALRAVIRHCIYAVDLNPLAVDLCRLALWLEGHEPGRPLTFLDHRVKCGNSLIGATPKTLEAGIPNEAFAPVTGDDKGLSRDLVKRNKDDHKRSPHQLSFGLTEPADAASAEEVRRARALVDLPEESVGESDAKAAGYAAFDALMEHKRAIADTWAAAFFWTLRPGDPLPPTQANLRALRLGGEHLTLFTALSAAQQARIRELVVANRIFHWHLEFPEVFGESGDGGFDCVLGNPPWEQLQLSEQEFFANRAPHIAELSGDARKRAIAALEQTDPTLAAAFTAAKHDEDTQTKFIRESGRFPLTAVGKLNTYALFAEHFRAITGQRGRAGLICPTGIATDDSTKAFFGDLVLKQSLVSYFGFKNEQFLFSKPVEHTVTFGLLTMLGSGQRSRQMEFTWLAYNVGHMNDPKRRHILTPEEIALVNPNTRTCPIFRTRADAELTRAIYRRVPVLVNEATGENPWHVSFRQGLFNMTSDSGLFRTRAQLDPGTAGIPAGPASSWDRRHPAGPQSPASYTSHDGGLILGPPASLPAPVAPQVVGEQAATANTMLGVTQFDPGTAGILPATGAGKDAGGPREGQPDGDGWTLDGNVFRKGDSAYLPLYEAKLLHQFDHRWATYDGAETRDLTAAEKADPSCVVLPRYWVPREEVESRLADRWGRGWLLGFRNITNATNERTAIFGLIPYAGVGNSAPVVLLDRTPKPTVVAGLVANLSALCFDYVVRQKIGGTNMNFFYVNQFPVLPPDAYSPADLDYIVPRVLELVYTAWDMQPFARDLGYDGPPFAWDEERRAVLRAELDAYYARLYGLTRKQLRYILDPHDLTDRELEDILDPYEDPPDAPRTRDFPGETFRVLKARELKQYGEYRTKRPVLAAWDSPEQSIPLEAHPPLAAVAGISASATDRHVALLCRIIAVHQAARQMNTLGDVKAEKLVYLVEQVCGLDLGRAPVREAAGPADFPRLHRAVHRAKMRLAFEMLSRPGGRGFYFKPLAGFQTRLAESDAILAPHTARIDRLIELFVGHDTAFAEKVATLYAVWNDLLATGATPTDEEILDDFYRWSPDKVKFQKEELRAALAFMRQQQLVPTGRGRVTPARAST